MRNGGKKDEMDSRKGKKKLDGEDNSGICSFRV